MTPPRATRTTYVAVAAALVLAGLAVHFQGAWIPTATRDVMGDALWAAMVTAWVSAVRPTTRPRYRYLISLGLCYAVELSQLWQLPALQSARGTTLGQLVLGSGFDLRDFAAYACGVLAFVALDKRWLMRSERVVV